MRMNRLADTLRLIAVLPLAVALSACTTPPLVPSAKEVAPLRTIDVVIYTPPTNFVYYYNDATTHVMTKPGSSVGTTVGVNIAANLLNSAAEHIKTATAREAEGPVGSSVAHLNLRAAVMRELSVASTSSKFIESQRAFPEGSPDYMEAVLPAISKPILNSSADAVLYVSVVPLFRNQFDQVVLTTRTWLVGRSGTPVLASAVRFIGPDHPELSRPELVQWWADQRYRRLIQQGLRASLKPTLDLLTNPPSEDQRAKLVALVSDLQPFMPNAERIRTTRCALASDDAPVVYRYERTGRILHAIAHCANEKPDLFDLAADPRHSWTTSIQPPLDPLLAK